MNIIFKGSPNYDNNRLPIDRIIMHWFGIGTLESANKRFQDDLSDVSAHYGISDETVYQWVSENAVAYHSGNYDVNQRSIGIEHDATTTKVASEATYNTSARLVADICKRYAIPVDREYIIGHKQVVPTQCPGTLDIDRIIAQARMLVTTNQIPEPIITDQTIIPKDRLNWVEDLEIQKIRSLLFEYKTQKTDLENTRKELQIKEQDIQKLMEELIRCQNQATTVFNGPKTAPIEERDPIIHLVRNFLKWFVSKFG